MRAPSLLVWPALGLVALGGCCFDPLAVGAPIAGGAGTGPMVATGGPRMPGGPGSAMFGAVVVAEGGLVAPDPTIVPGIAGGPFYLSTLASECIGHAGPVPGHRLVVEGAAPVRLRVMAYATSGQDLTIAVRGPDGRMRCNDDSDGLMPLVEDALAPGEYDVWVGTYGAGLSGVGYELGVSTSALVTPSVLHGAAASRPSDSMLE